MSQTMYIILYNCGSEAVNWMFVIKESFIKAKHTELNGFRSKISSRYVEVVLSDVLYLMFDNIGAGVNITVGLCRKNPVVYPCCMAA